MGGGVVYCDKQFNMQALICIREFSPQKDGKWVGRVGVGLQALEKISQSW